MKILVLSQLYYIEGRDDLKHDTSAVHYLVKYWAREHQVQVINTYINYRNHIFRYLNPKNLVYYWKGYPFEKDGVNVYLLENQLLTRRFFQKWNWDRLIRKIPKLLRKEQFNDPDIILSHFPCYSYGYIDRMGWSGKKIAVLHESDVYAAKHDPAFLPALRQRYDACFARSEKIRRYFAEQGLTNLRDDIIYSGAPTSGISTERDWMACRERPMRLLYAGKLLERKHVDWIICAVSSIDRSRFVMDILGAGGEEAALKNLVQELGMENNIRFHGSVPRETVLEYMKQADIFCMPSTGETFGLVYLEAMANGCLTIGTTGEGIDGVIADRRNGFLISGQEELTQLLEDLLLHMPYETMQEISEQAVKTGHIFSEEHMSERYLKLINEG